MYEHQITISPASDLDMCLYVIICNLQHLISWELTGRWFYVEYRHKKVSVVFSHFDHWCGYLLGSCAHAKIIIEVYFSERASETAGWKPTLKSSGIKYYLYIYPHITCNSRKFSSEEEKCNFWVFYCRNWSKDTHPKDWFSTA